jgi:hypothetical protein
MNGRRGEPDRHVTSRAKDGGLGENIKIRVNFRPVLRYFEYLDPV